MVEKKYRIKRKKELEIDNSYFINDITSSEFKYNVNDVVEMGRAYSTMRNIDLVVLQSITDNTPVLLDLNSYIHFRDEFMYVPIKYITRGHVFRYKAKKYYINYTPYITIGVDGKVISRRLRYNGCSYDFRYMNECYSISENRLYV